MSRLWMTGGQRNVKIGLEFWKQNLQFLNCVPISLVLVLGAFSCNGTISLCIFSLSVIPFRDSMSISNSLTKVEIQRVFLVL